jgi:hypothetical protein
MPRAEPDSREGLLENQHTSVVPANPSDASAGFRSSVGAFGSLRGVEGATWKKVLAAGCMLLVVLLVAVGIVVGAKKVGVSCEVAHCNGHGGCKKNDDDSFRSCDCDRGAHIVGLSCSCESGWAGQGCEHPTGCDTAPCAHGTCTADGGNHACACAEGWTGGACAEATGCDSHPDCGHGTCVANGGNHTCACASGWKGSRCAVGAFRYWAEPMAPKHSPQVRRTVLVMRHCVRAATAGVKAGQDGMDSQTNYTSHGPIHFPVEAYMCVPRGLTLGSDGPGPAAAIADDALFKPSYNQDAKTGLPGCVATGASAQEELIRARWATFPYYCGNSTGCDGGTSSTLGLSHRDVMARVQELLGTGGVAAPITGYSSSPGMSSPAADHVSGKNLGAL